MEPFVGHVPSSRLRFSHRKLANLHPAEIADLVEAASHEEGEELIEAVAQDRELEADVFEELDEHHQLEFIRERPDDQVAAVVSRMAADDAADLIVELDQDRRGRVLALLPPAQTAPDRGAARLQPLDGRRADEPRLRQRRSRGERGARARDGAHERPCARAPSRPSTCSTPSGELKGAAFVVTLLRADPAAALEEVAEREPVSVAPTPTCPRSRG